MVAEANESATLKRQEAERYTRELMSDARLTAQEVRDEGLELVTNLRQMGDSLRANAERLLRDVQSVHSQMVARIDKAESNGRLSPVPTARNGRSDGGRSARSGRSDDIPDVPEFIPGRG
jgi:hypothetical protein